MKEKSNQTRKTNSKPLEKRSCMKILKIFFCGRRKFIRRFQTKRGPFTKEVQLRKGSGHERERNEQFYKLSGRIFELEVGRTIPDTIRTS